MKEKGECNKTNRFQLRERLITATSKLSGDWILYEGLLDILRRVVGCWNNNHAIGF